MESEREDTRREGVCTSCGERWKYRCPGCDRLSCSLQCVRKHKVDHGCDGRRCKTSYVSLSKFSDAQLLSDYYFLEEVGRFTDSTHRERQYSNKKHLDSKPQRQTFFRLRSAAKRRGTRLRLLAPGMSLHSINTSRTVWHGHRRGCEIRWRVHLNFPHSTAGYQEDSVPEATVLTDLLNKYIHPTKSDPIARHRLRRYVEGGGVESVNVFMKVEATQSRYHHLDKNKTLAENLANKDVIEFPIFHVVLSSEASSYLTVNPPAAIAQAPPPVPPPPTTPKDPEDGPSNSPPTAENSAKTVGITPTSSLQLIAQMYSDESDSD